MTEADTTRGRHVVVGATRHEAVSYFGPELEDVFVTSFADFDDEVPPGSCSQVSLLWDEGASPVVETLLRRVAEDPEIRLVIASPGGTGGLTSTTTTPSVDTTDWTVESLNRRVAELEREVGVARTDTDAARALLATARGRNRRLRGQLDSRTIEPGEDRQDPVPAGSLDPRRMRLAKVLSGGMLVLAVALPVALAAADDFSVAVVTSALVLGVCLVLVAMVGLAILQVWPELRRISELAVSLHADRDQCNERAADLDIRLHDTGARIDLLSSRLHDLGEEQHRALTDLGRRVTIAYRTGATADRDD
jgi:hypothetical protein